jgi:hypothetical protein
MHFAQDILKAKTGLEEKRRGLVAARLITPLA